MERPPFHIGMRVGNEILQKQCSHYGIEFGALIEGRGMYRIGDKEYALEAGDCYFFDANLPHLLIPDAGPSFLSLFIEIYGAAIHALVPFEDNIELLKPFFDTAAGRAPIVTGQPALAIVGKAQRYIADNFRNSFTLADLARQCCASESYVSHMFAKVFNISPIRYRNEMRIKWAYQKIIENTESIESIADQAGFSSYSQFVRLFKSVSNKSPGQLRQSKI